MPLRQYVAWAYNGRAELTVGPDWIGSARFDIAAKAKEPVPIDEMRLMMRNLLRERFHLAMHTETRQVEVNTLVVGKEGLRHLDEASPDNPESIAPGPIMPDGIQHWTFKNVSMADFAFFPGKVAKLDDAVVDSTHIKGKFDFGLDLRIWESEMAPHDYRFSVVFPALYTQLGLRLEAHKAPVEVVVIDNVDKVPTEN
jgi:uncharacterized protein (TIGR03435 family)